MSRVGLALALAVLLAGCGASGSASPTPVERTVVVEPPSPTPRVVERNVIVQQTVTVVQPSPSPVVRTVTIVPPTPMPVSGLVNWSVSTEKEDVQGDWRVWYVGLSIQNEAGVRLTDITLTVTVLDADGAELDTSTRNFGLLRSGSSTTFEQWQAIDIEPDDVGSEARFVFDLSYELADER